MTGKSPIALGGSGPKTANAIGLPPNAIGLLPYGDGFSDQVTLVGDLESLVAAVDAQLPVDGTQMVAHGAWRDV